MLEGLRGDNDLTSTGLTLSQNLSVGLFVAFGAMLVFVLIKAPFGFKSQPGILQKSSTSGKVAA
jgi:hypothetical protein